MWNKDFSEYTDFTMGYPRPLHKEDLVKGLSQLRTGNYTKYDNEKVGYIMYSEYAEPMKNLYGRDKRVKIFISVAKTVLIIGGIIMMLYLIGRML